MGEVFAREDKMYFGYFRIFYGHMKNGGDFLVIFSRGRIYLDRKFEDWIYFVWAITVRQNCVLYNTNFYQVLTQIYAHFS